MSELNLAVVGVGQWGRHLLAAFARTPRCRVRTICDSDVAALRQAAAAHPDTRAEARWEAVFDDSHIDAVAIATDAPTHFAMTRAALERGKHVFVEKPLAMSSGEAAELMRVSQRAGRKLMIGHVLEYHPAVRAIETMIERGDLGRLYYVYTQRINLGVVRRHENAWWSLAPHDVAVICRWFGGAPQHVAAQGQSFLEPGVEDVVFASLLFGDGRLAHVHVSWLDPHKVRKMTLVGSRRMVTFDDMSSGEKVRVYDKGVDRGEPLRAFPDEAAHPAENRWAVPTLRVGDIVIPKIAGDEPLSVECGHFVDAVLDDRPVLTDAANGLRVVKVLEAGQRSLASGGGLVRLEEVKT
jgi:predicted dehydrogenase